MAVRLDGRPNHCLLDQALVALRTMSHLPVAAAEAAPTEAWAATWDYGGGGDYVQHIAVDGQNNVSVAVRAQDASNDCDVILLKYDASGSIEWTYIVDSAGTDLVYDVIVGHDDLPVMVGAPNLAPPALNKIPNTGKPKAAPTPSASRPPTTQPQTKRAKKSMWASSAPRPQTTAPHSAKA